MVSSGETPTLVDLFCGAGGLSLGFQRAGFRPIRAIDNWKPAIYTYQANIGGHVMEENITEFSEIPKSTVIAGGPPCQGFSSAGKRRDDDERNSLVTVFARIVARKKPQAFVFENVEGFLTGADGRFVLDLLAPVLEAGYRVHLRKINAANYGVPQHRKRVVAIGGLGWDPSFPQPTHSAHGAPGAHLAAKLLTPTPCLAESLADLPPPSDCEPGTPPDHVSKPLEGLDLARAELLQPGQRMRDLPEKLWHDSYRRRAFRRVMDGMPTERRGGAPSGVRRLRADEPSKSITGGSLRDFLHPSEHRPLTNRECAHLQTFPDDFVFFGSKADRAQLIGNAVPPLLARIIAELLLSDLNAPQEIKSGGALLTFVPTLSSGMSPALESVASRVRRRFGVGVQKELQRALWD
ncbi:MAG: DNA cytosine methyltransferase [Planctomycetes bacterium]|nr:DNA cytosine methyltransferase [Planctomycetota bacterium]MBU4397811.1 DNA cytosine methyltransferase [Planctomycetota bacterium]